jgi:hypothetical protein
VGQAWDSEADNWVSVQAGAAALTEAGSWASAGQAVAAWEESAFADGAVSSRDRPSSAVLSGLWGRRTSLAGWTWSWTYPDR